MQGAMYIKTDRIEYVVERCGNKWAVYSLVMTNFGSKPAKNYIVERDSKDWCEGFAAALRAQESRRDPKPLDPGVDWAEALRRMDGQ